jgi:membrane protein insertase Oxa1/YidC/SpoIIIJ
MSISFSREQAVYGGLIVLLVLYIVNYFALFLKGQAIIKQKEEFSAQRLQKRKYLYWSYVLITFLSFFMSVANLVEPI